MSDEPWWRGSVVYEIYPRSFQDSTGNGIGDLPGISQRLGEVSRLGVDAVWLAPFFRSPQRDFGYDISAHDEIDPVFGSMQDFEELVERAHDLDLKVLIDAVLNHTSDEHPWFEDSRRGQRGDRCDWYQWADPRPDGSPPNNWRNRYGGSQWTWEPRRAQYYRHQYASFQPALNLSSEEVQNAQFDIMRFWRDRGVDGFRFDATCQYCHHGIEHDNPAKDDPSPVYNSYNFQRHIKDINGPGTEDVIACFAKAAGDIGCSYTFAELDVLEECIPTLSRYTGENAFKAAYTPLPMSLTPCPSDFASLIDLLHEHACVDKFVWCLTNHDADRLVTRAGKAAEGDVAAYSCLMAALAAALPGQVSVFQGEELGLRNADYERDQLKDVQGKVFWPEESGRDAIRHPYPWTDGPGAGFTTGKPWLPLDDRLLTTPFDKQDKDESSPLAVWRQNICIRKDYPSLRLGEARIVAADDEIGHLAFVRRHGDADLVRCDFAMGKTSVHIPEVSDEAVIGGQAGPTLKPLGWRYALVDA